MTAPYDPEPYEPYLRTYYGGLSGVKDDDIVAGMTDYLMQQPSLLEMVGIEPGTEVPFIFQERILKPALKGSGSNAIVINYMGDWASPTRSLFESVRMSIRIYADPLRDELGNATPGADAEARRRIVKIYHAIDLLLNVPTHGSKLGDPELRFPESAQGGLWMGEVKTTDHTRLGTITIAPEPDGDGMLRGEVFYGLTIAGYRPVVSP